MATNKANIEQFPQQGTNIQPEAQIPLNGAPDAPQRDALVMKAQMQMANLAENEDMRAKLKSIKPPIGEEQVREASQILQKYKAGKARLEAKIIANEQFWKLRQWNYMNDGKNDFKPATAWLWSCIQSRYSDVMDSYPTCNVKPRQEDDKPEASKLSSIIPVVMEQNRFEETYSDIAWYVLKHGGGVYGVFWDSSKHNGLGDINIRKIDFINLFWESGITDIQESEHLFNTELVSNRLLEQRYPQTKGKLNGDSVTLAKYLYDDHVDTSDKSVVVDWYYHTEHNGKKVLQYCKYVNDIVLYATENEVIPETRQDIDPETGVPVETIVGGSMATRGLYDHGKYPFVVQSLYPIEGSICGYGLTDIGRDTQIQIDLMNKAIIDNTLLGAKPRYFVRNDGSINEKEFADITRDLVHVEGSLDENNLRVVDYKSLEKNYIVSLQQKIDELKYVTSNQDANNGIAPSGVTAGSAISALQEVAGKNARSSNKGFHRAYREVIYQVIELIRQFYDVPRMFRITGENGDEFVSYDNSMIKPQPQMIMGMDMGLRTPEFDIDVTSEKASPYKKMEMNELALNFYQQGFFNPQASDQVLACLDMMDFTGKEDVVNTVRKNGTMLELLQSFEQMAMGLAQKYDPAMAEQIAMMIQQSSGVLQQMGGGEQIDLDASNEHPYNTKARAQARASTQAD